MRSPILSATTAVLLLAAVVPGALAAEPTVTEAPVQVEAPTPSPTATGPYDGTIVVDPTFVSGGVLPTQRPRQPQAPVAPGLTPPPTDAIVSSAPSGAGLAVPALILASSVVLALAVAPRPARRRTPRRA